MTGRTKPFRQLGIPVLILVAVTAPLVLAVVVYLRPGWFAFGHTNHGHLVRPPVKIHEDPLPRLFASGTLREGYFHGRWTLVYIGGHDCRADCKAALYATRQARLATGEQMRRVQRLYVVRGNGKTPPELGGLRSDLTVVEASGAKGRSFTHQFTAVQAAGGIYVVDPNALLMMTYPERANPEGLLKDLRHLVNVNPS